MTLARTGLRTALAALALVCAPSSSKADPDGTQEQKAAAQALFEQARSLVEQARFAEACPKFVESERIDPGIGTMLWLADCYENTGRTASAWVSFKEAAAAAARRRDRREHVARERAARLESKLSRLTIDLSPGAAVGGLQVHRDGMLVGNAEWGLALPVDPGSHTVTATAPGRRSWSSTVQIGAGRRLAAITVPVLAAWPADSTDLGRVSPPGPPPERASPEAPPADRPRAADSPVDLGRGNAERIAGVGVGGVGIAALAVGTVFSFEAKATYDESNAGGYCLSNNECNAIGKSDRSRAESMALVATVALGGGAAAAAGGAILFFAAPKPVPAVALAPSRRGANLHATWTW